MEATNATGRYLTLRDYLRVLGRYRLAIIVITVLGAAAGFVTAKRQTPTYTASATVSIQDPQQNVTLAGLIPGPSQQPFDVATQASETLTRPSVMLAVRRALHSKASVASLSSAVSGQVTQGGLLEITATASDPAAAARLANTVATTLVSQNNQSAQATFRAEAKALTGEIAALPAAQRRANDAGLTTLEQQQAKLEALGHVARTSQLAAPAAPPTSAASPHKVRSTLIGGVLGLLLAIAAVFLRDTLDRRLRTGEDVETSFHIPVLARVRNKPLGKIAQIAALSDDEHLPDVEAFRILRRNLEALSIDSPPRSVIVTSAAGEEGKTTVAGSLAFAMASAGQRTLLVDCDLRQPTLAGRLGVRQSPGMSEFLMGLATPAEIINPIAFDGVASRDGGGSIPLVMIPAGTPSPHSAELLRSNAFREFLQQVLEAYEVVVFDSSPLLPVSDTLEMLPHVDAVLVCARESKTTRGEAQAVKTALERFPGVSAGIVITGVRPGPREYAVYGHGGARAT